MLLGGDGGWFLELAAVVEVQHKGFLFSVFHLWLVSLWQLFILMFNLNWLLLDDDLFYRRNELHLYFVAYLFNSFFLGQVLLLASKNIDFLQSGIQFLKVSIELMESIFQLHIYPIISDLSIAFDLLKVLDVLSVSVQTPHDFNIYLGFLLVLIRHLHESQSFLNLCSGMQCESAAE